jgi:hypothetical protein
MTLLTELEDILKMMEERGIDDELYKKTKTVKTTFESVFYQFVEHKK